MGRGERTDGGKERGGDWNRVMRRSGRGKGKKGMRSGGEESE